MLFFATTQIMQELETDLVTFRGCVDAVGTAHDSLENRDQLKELRTKILNQITQCEQKLAVQKKSRNPQSKIMFDRLSRQLNTQVDQFNDLMEREKVASRKHSKSYLVRDGEEKESIDSYNMPLTTWACMLHSCDYSYTTSAMFTCCGHGVKV